MIKALGYYLCLPILYLVSVLPFWIVYGISDILFLFIYYVLKYRRQIVFKNLQNSFPNKSNEELKKIEKKFYKHFIDLILETIQTLTISKKSIKKRCYLQPKAKQLFESYYQNKKSVIIVMGHFGNWEWAGASFSSQCNMPLFVIYHSLKSSYFDKLLYKMRTRFGTQLYAMQDASRGMIRNKNNTTATAFIADQTPQPDKAYWLTFLNQDTPIFFGTERIAQTLDVPIVYVSVLKTKRGYYSVDAEILVPQPKQTETGDISELHTKRLEQDILLQPENWLWSHRRWKHKRL